MPRQTRQDCLEFPAERRAYLMPGGFEVEFFPYGVAAYRYFPIEIELFVGDELISYRQEVPPEKVSG